MKYKTLQKEFHSSSSSSKTYAEDLYQQRFNSEDAVHYPFVLHNDPLFYILTPEIRELTAQLNTHNSKFRNSWNKLPDQTTEEILQKLVIHEVIATNEIEGITTTQTSITDSLKATNTHGISYHYGKLAHHNAIIPQTPSDLRTFYDLFMHNELAPDQKLDGELFRKHPVQIVDGNHKTVHSGFFPEVKIIDGIHTSLDLLNTGNLIDALVSHFMFETVHPFYDGNGRVGRFLLSMRLSELLSPAVALTLSSSINRNVSKYYKAFQNVEHPLNRSDCTPFVIFLLEILLAGQLAGQQELENLIKHHP
ncbi:Fic family protein [Corynebacterium suranareeae]|uniref:Fic family protein n=1 Tax=Corynebacterium suranareeae TaxID=2506452 RepID=A0A160PMH1_9CORY|nr:Fic family protein [Corynebacterium suranareeae]BAU94474.1 Fic family protein [Corynebacterium suranareeae]